MKMNSFNAIDSPKSFIYASTRYVPFRKCNRCGGLILRSDTQWYTYQCMNCDEDLYDFETHFDDVVTVSDFEKLYCDVRDLLLLDSEKKTYQFRENDIYIEAEKDTLIKLVHELREVGAEGTLSDLAFQIEYEFNVDGVRDKQS